MKERAFINLIVRNPPGGSLPEKHAPIRLTRNSDGQLSLRYRPLDPSIVVSLFFDFAKFSRAEVNALYVYSFGTVEAAISYRLNYFKIVYPSEKI